MSNKQNRKAVNIEVNDKLIEKMEIIREEIERQDLPVAKYKDRPANSAVIEFAINTTLRTINSNSLHRSRK